MKKVLLYLLGGLVLIVAITLVVASTRPSQWSVERSVVIEAPKELVWPYLSSLNRFEQWSPYAKLDPQMKKSNEGTPGEVGSSYAWDGNAKAGAGKMTITGLRPYERVDIRLDFVRPFPAVNEVAFIEKPEGSATQMTWSMSGRYEGFPGLIGKVVGLFVDMDSMIGKDFETGLMNLKSLVEPEAAVAAQKAAAEAAAAAAQAAKTSIEKNEEKKELIVIRTFDAPRAQLWKAWTDPKQLTRWWGPKSYTSPEAKIALKVGGKYLVAMQAPEGKLIWSTGTYHKIEPHARLEMDDSFADAKGKVVSPAAYGLPADFPEKLELVVSFEDVEAGKSKLTIIHKGIPAGQILDMTAAGWAESLDKLDGTLLNF